MKTFKEIREGYVSAAQRRAVWASRADGGKGHPDKKKSKKEDAVADFLAKGGKIKKLPPAKAQGYHGKDDPGKGMAGMMDKGDTKGLPRKKVKSMESSEINELSPATHSKYQKAAAKSAARGAAKFGAGKMSADDALANQKKRQKGIDTSKYLNRKQHGVKESVSSVAASAKGDHKAHMKAAKAHAIAAIKHMDQYKETNDPAHQKAAKLHRKAEQSHEGAAKLHKTSNNGQTKMTRTSIANKSTAAANAASEDV